MTCCGNDKFSLFGAVYGVTSADHERIGELIIINKPLRSSSVSEDSWKLSHVLSFLTLEMNQLIRVWLECSDKLICVDACKLRFFF